MRQPIDTLTYATRDAIEKRIEGMLDDPVSGVTVTYNVPGTQSINANDGTVTNNTTTRTLRAWCGVPIETEVPGPDTEERKYIVLGEDLRKPTAINPRRGDWITHAGIEWGIDRIEPGSIGDRTLYYMFTATMRAP